VKGIKKKHISTVLFHPTVKKNPVHVKKSPRLQERIGSEWKLTIYQIQSCLSYSNAISIIKFCSNTPGLQQRL
jgi:hypothetical protein